MLDRLPKDNIKRMKIRQSLEVEMLQSKVLEETKDQIHFRAQPGDIKIRMIVLTNMSLLEIQLETTKILRWHILMSENWKTRAKASS